MLWAEYQKIIDIWCIYLCITKEYLCLLNFFLISMYYRLFQLVFTKNILGNSVWKTSLGVLIPFKWYQIWIKLHSDVSCFETFWNVSDKTKSNQTKPKLFLSPNFLLKNLSTVPAEFQWNSTGVMENYWKMTGANGTSGIPLNFRWNSSSS